MIRRLGFRRFLPLAQITLYFALLTIGYFQQPPPVKAIQEHVGTWQPAAPPNIPLAWKAAVALNVPAVVCGALLTSIFYPRGTELFALMFTAPFVPLLWLLIGRWLDYQLRILPRPPKTVKRVIFAIVGLIIGTFGIVSALVSIPDITYPVLTGPVLMTLAWSCLLILMCGTALLRSRKHKKRATWSRPQPSGPVA